MQATIADLTDKVKEQSAWVGLLRDELSGTIVGQRYLVDRLIVALLANGHVLLEGVPGLAKTLAVSTLAKSIQADFKRIQFTPDLLPADIVGTLIYNPQKAEFITKKGPIFANIILADEINRAPAKVQSALLEAMQERQVTLGEDTHKLPEPFLVLATQNPIDQEGTYSLPEAQVDRFMLKVHVDYPSHEEELLILEKMAKTSAKPSVKAVLRPKEILEARKLIDELYIDPKLSEYIVQIVMATRNPEQAGLKLGNFIQYGASPRATISLALAAKAWAYMQGRGFTTPQDVRNIAYDVLRHRVIVSYEGEAEGMTSEVIIKKILETVPIP